MNGLNFTKMKPVYDVILHSPGMLTRTLANPGKEYAIYIEGNNKNQLTLTLPEGVYNSSWYNVETGLLLMTTEIKSYNRPVLLGTPEFKEAAALKIVAK